MKNAQAKIDALLDLLLDDLQDRILIATDATRPPLLAELRGLIELSNLNNDRLAKIARPAGPQSKLHSPEATSDEDLVASLKANRPKDLFPRKGPPNGKRPPIAPLPEKPEPAFCAIHTGVICVGNPDPTGTAMWVCPECVKESPPVGIVSLKALL